MIDFTRAFDSAWERTHVVLFRPLDPAKWFIIGFNSFLALLAENGVSFNYNSSYSFNGQSQAFSPTYHSLPALLHGLKQAVAEAGTLNTSAWLALYLALAVIYVIAWLTLSWVGARGEFMLLDNIVRNRAAISWPWRHYARQGNTWFLFNLGLVLVSLVLLAGSGAGFLGLNWTWINGERDPAGTEIGALIGGLLVFAALWIVYSAVVFVLRSFVIPIYFKGTLSFGASLQAVGRLIAADPLSVLVYVLLSLCLTLACALLIALLLLVVCCLICWLACIPLVGTMLLSFIVCQMSLPILIFYRCFQLDCLAQFGPQSDVWTVDVPPAASSP
jgi:hypothetical protein